MAQEQIQEQQLTQQQRLTQAITQQQLLQAQLVELPVAQLAERINAEMDDNPALEVSADDYDGAASGSDAGNAGSDAADSASDTSDAADDYEREERQSALDEALQGIGRDDEELPVYNSQGHSVDEEREEMVYGDTQSFYDQLREQVSMVHLTAQEQTIMEYLIGSLDDDGLLRKSLDAISDELAIYHNCDVSVGEIESVLLKLQQFDPAGIGARSLQECLLLQIARREPSPLQALMETVVTKYFDMFTKKHWDQLRRSLQIGEMQMDQLLSELRHLNPRPGASLGETVGRSLQHITPDFIVDTHDDGTVTFTLNMGDIPELHVSRSFAETLKEYQNNRDSMSPQMKEALLYTKRKVDAAQGFIDAVRMRRNTLSSTMRAVIKWQHRFFEEGDEALLRPMKLKDIAEKTGFDLSTISRVSKSKYAQTRWGTFPLRYFFSDGYKTDSGEELSTRQIKAALRDIIDTEDKQKPLSDDALTRLMASRGYPIARRTVAKYREQMGIPVARLRR